EVFEDVEVYPNSQEQHATDDDEIMIHNGKQLTRIFVAGIAEEERLGCKPKGLDDQVHEHCKLVVSAKDAKRMGTASSGVKIVRQPGPERDPGEHLVGGARQPGKHDWKSVH